jgi:hypothetical protein
MWNKTRDEARAYWANTKWLGPRYKHMLDLDDEFPEVGMFEPSCISAEVGPGWVPLLRPVLAVLRKFGCKVGQIKQKFCVLVVHWDAPDEGLSHVGASEIQTVIETCARISTYSCEGCGRYVPEGAGEPMGGRRYCESCLKAARD